MGAIHQGHLALCKQAAQESQTPVASIFVNPLQFGPNEDQSNYPRQQEQDCALAEESGIQWMFIPDPEKLTQNIHTTISVSNVTSEYEGPRRPGHFDGVATIVVKLFNIVGCQKAYFGLKDLQQCALIRQFVHDLNMPIELRFLETVREESGLAMSSRNAYFTKEQKEEAAFLHQSLANIASQTQKDPQNLQIALYEATQSLSQKGFAVEYLDCVDPTSMKQTSGENKDSRLIVAAKFHGVRLIDNIPLYS